MPQITITISKRDLVFLKKLASESEVSRSEKARELLRLGITAQVKEENALMVYLGGDEKRANQQILIEQLASAYESIED